jgi:hypothetical protein
VVLIAGIPALLWLAARLDVLLEGRL